MATTIVICDGIDDYKFWLNINIGYQHRTNTRSVVINDRRYIAVSRYEHLIGHRCDTISFTTLGSQKENFNELLRMATTYCLARIKKPFKFGR